MKFEQWIIINHIYINKLINHYYLIATLQTQTTDKLHTDKLQKQTTHRHKLQTPTDVPVMSLDLPVWGIWAVAVQVRPDGAGDWSRLLDSQVDSRLRVVTEFSQVVKVLNHWPMRQKPPDHCQSFDWLPVSHGPSLHTDLGAPWMVNILSECCSASRVITSYSCLHTWTGRLDQHVHVSELWHHTMLHGYDITQVWQWVRLNIQTSPTKSLGETLPLDSSHSCRCWCRSRRGCRAERKQRWWHHWSSRGHHRSSVSRSECQ